MTTVKEVWALDDTVINDGLMANSGEWLSILRDPSGLPEVQARRAKRTGRYPLVSEIEQESIEPTLETWFGQADADLRAALQAYHQALRRDASSPIRLLLADHIYPNCAPDKILLSLAAWDIYRDASAWYVQDLLRQVTGTLAGGWRVWPGEGLQFGLATTNKVLNPVAGATGNYASLGAATVTRTASYSYYGLGDYFYSFNVAATAAANDGVQLTLSALANAIHYATTRFRGNFPTSTMRWSLDGVTWNSPTLLGTHTGDDGETWSVYGFKFPAIEANGSTHLYIRQTDATARTYQVDGAQVEERGTPTPLCAGDMGPGHSWSGTEHASTSSRTKTELSFSRTMPSQWTVLAWAAPMINDWALMNTVEYVWWWGTATDYAGVRASAAADALQLNWVNSGGSNYYDTITATDPAGAHSFFFVVLTFDGTTLKAYYNPTSSTPAATRVPDALLAVNPTVFYPGANSTGGSQLNGWLDDVAVLSRALTGAEVLKVYQAGRDWRPRWLEVFCERSAPMRIKGRPVHRAREADLVVHREPRKRSMDGDVHVWRIYDGDEETTIPNEGDDVAYPTIYITPKTAKSTDYAYKRWVPFIWKALYGATTYPSMIVGGWATGPGGGTPIGDGKMQADGDDLRVFVDGFEVDRWLTGINTADTKVWINLDFDAGIALTLAVGFGAGDTVETLSFNEDITDLPSEGILHLDNGATTETFTYTGKSNALKRVSGVTRAAKGTTARAFSANDDAYWIQHDIWVLYGNSGVSAPTVDGDYEPALNMTNSDNDNWVFTEFGEDDGLRAFQWIRDTYAGTSPTFYGGNHATSADPWVELGIECYGLDWDFGQLRAYNPCGITRADFTNGEKWSTNVAYWDAYVRSSPDGNTWADDYTIPAPAVGSNWEAWSQNVTLTSGAFHVALYCIRMFDKAINRVEAADAELWLNTTYTPDRELGDEQGNYSLAATITNATTGDAIEVSLIMGLDETLEIDTGNKTVTALADDSNQVQAVTQVGGARLDWLPLDPGDNVLTYEDANTVEVEVEILHTRRYDE